jgi:outer membrane receptor protein involved in Fe transport
MKIKKFTLFLAYMLLGVMLLAQFSSYGQTNSNQTTLTGKIIDSKNGESLPGAVVLIKGSSAGVASGLDGNFKFKTKETGDQVVVIRTMGFTPKELNVNLKGSNIDLGTISLDIEAVNLDEVSVVASMAIDRKTPVAVSNITQAYIEDKLGNNEFPEILRQTPGIYASKDGGGFGDSRVTVRGFDTRNTAVMINGVPVNDMENGTVYWSNWAGLADVTRNMQVQRGLGASKMAVPSVGGTINILTNTTDAVRGGNIFYGISNDNMVKYGATVSTGLSKSGWASTISLSKNTGNGYADATNYESYSYFFNVSKKINDKHSLAFTIFGAPQWHNQRPYTISVANFEKYGLRYNDQWGYYNGQVLDVKKNFYNKPQAILNHYFHINDNTELTTALYASTGTGGGTGTVSGITDRTSDGLLDFSKVAAKNATQGLLGSSNIINTSNNDHIWYGIFSTLKYKLDNLTVTSGIDARSYVGQHYQEVVNLLGGQFYIDKPSTSSGDVNNPNKVSKPGDIIGYHNDGNVRWYGVFSQAEYTMDKLTVFAAGSVSDKWYQRVDYMRYFSDDVKSQINGDPTVKAQYLAALGQKTFDQAMSLSQKSVTKDIIGYSVKGGSNYNLTDNMNVFFNTGYFERQPDFNTVFPNNVNILNKSAKNEKVLGFELGYGFRNNIIKANLNAYYTQWNNKTFVLSQPSPSTGQMFFANVTGVNALHKGIELELNSAPAKNLRINGMISWGDWKWTNDIVNVQVYDDNQTPIGSPVNLKLKDVHDGNTAQHVFGGGIDYDLNSGFGIGANYTYFDNLYANFTVTSHTTTRDVWKMPSYGLLDMNMKYYFKIGGMSSTLIFNANNILNTQYFLGGTDADMSQPGAKMNALVYYGKLRSGSLSLKIKF